MIALVLPFEFFFSRGSYLIFQLQSLVQSNQQPLRVPHHGGLACSLTGTSQPAEPAFVYT